MQPVITTGEVISTFRALLRSRVPRMQADLEANDVAEVCRMCCTSCNSYKQIAGNTRVVAVERPGRGMARHVLRLAVRTGWSAVPYAPNSYPARQSSTDVRMTMLWTLFVVLLLLWLLGVVSSYTLGGFIHLLLVLAVVAVLVQLITGRRAV
jgi:hypothetical protein